MAVKVKIVTGYIPIAGHPRTPQEYGAFGEKLKELKAPIHPFYGVVTSTWLYKLIEQLPFDPIWAVSDNPQKNTLAYHCATHQKFQWLYDASRMDDKSDVFVWMDYGLAHIPGWSPAGVNAFLDRIKKNDFAIPGCWPIGEINDDNPCWRFCGGLIVVPRKYVQDYKNLVQAITMLHVNVTKKVTFDPNTMARAEQANKLPMRWYLADHNQTMWENY